MSPTSYQAAPPRVTSLPQFGDQRQPPNLRKRQVSLGRTFVKQKDGQDWAPLPGCGTWGGRSHGKKGARQGGWGENSRQKSAGELRLPPRGPVRGGDGARRERGEVDAGGDGRHHRRVGVDRARRYLPQESDGATSAAHRVPARAAPRAQALAPRERDRADQEER